LDSLALTPTLARVLISILVGAAVLILALFFSFAQGLFYGLLTDVRARAQALRRVVLDASARFLSERLAAFWAARAVEPRAPVVSELSRLNDAVEKIGVVQVQAIVDAERRIGLHLNALRSIQQPDGIDSASDRDRLVESISGTSLFSLIFLVLFAVAIGAVNSFLLAIFFREVIGNYRVLPYPLPDLQAANLIALIIFFAEVATGWAIYRSGERQSRSPAARSAGAGFFGVIPWIMLGVLSIVELAAYSTLSLRVNLGDRLHLDAAGYIHPIAQFFLSFLGIGLTLLLAYLGHAIAEGTADRRRSALARGIVTALRRGKSTALGQVAQLREHIESIRRTATDFPTSISEGFTRELGIREHQAPVLATVERFAVGALTLPDRAAIGETAPADAPRVFRAVRTPTQVWGDLFVSASLLIALLFVATLTTMEVVSLMLELQGGTQTAVLVAWIAGIAAPMTVIGLGALAWNILREMRYAAPVPTALPERLGQMIISWVAVGALVAAAVALVAIALAMSNNREPVMFGALAVLQAGAMICFAGFADRGVVAIVHLLYLLWLAIVRGGALALAAVASVLDALCFAMRIVVRVLAIPGDVMRGRLTEPAVSPAR
jgi:hypothetical protein